MSGTFYSTYRRRSVVYSIAYPPGHRQGDDLPLVLFLHGYGGNHVSTGLGISTARALAARMPDHPALRTAIATVDGGPGYWNPHSYDDPLGMLVHEFLPLCTRRGLGRPSQGMAATGLSMGGYGALLLAEKEPSLIRAVAAMSPAIWTTYDQARAANATAFASPAAFAAGDVIAHSSALTMPVRIAIGFDDPFLPGVEALEPQLPAGATVIVTKGCHTASFFDEQLLPSLAFVAKYLGARAA